MPLAIEEGRRQNIDVRDRICKFCNLGDIEDEYHFLLVCPFYEVLRQDFLPLYCQTEPNIQKLTRILQTKNTTTLLNLCKFIYKAFSKRKISDVE